jgi:hypothetical protein
VWSLPFLQAEVPGLQEKADIRLLQPVADEASAWKEKRCSLVKVRSPRCRTRFPALLFDDCKPIC